GRDLEQEEANLVAVVPPILDRERAPLDLVRTAMHPLRTFPACPPWAERPRLVPGSVTNAEREGKGRSVTRPHPRCRGARRCPPMGIDGSPGGEGASWWGSRRAGPGRDGGRSAVR